VLRGGLRTAATSCRELAGCCAGTTAASSCLASMPRYFFHIAGRRPYVDVTGDQFRHNAAAWEAAMRAMRDLEHGYNAGDQWQLEVGEDETPVFVIQVTSSRLR
jgi:hypothetical protein